MNQSGRSPLTLLVASVSSAAAALVVRELWAPGTIASAALTPVLIALFGELLHRPAHRLTRVARERLNRWNVVSLRSIDPIARIPSRWQRVLSTAGVAFLIGSVALTGWELLIHHSLASARDRTTLWGGAVPRRPDRHATPPPRTPASPAVQAPAPRRRRAVHSHKHVQRTPPKRTTQAGRPQTRTTPAATTTAAAPTTTAPAATTTAPGATPTTTTPTTTLPKLPLLP
ncbi:MAG TPA: hypothetical protein VH137_07140 [Gemmatimonadales bacterium]|nr:hypothetical protein [Gemmatimonadales bacterium]